MIEKNYKSDYQISTDPKDIDFDRLHNYLANESYWSQNIPQDILRRAIENSFNFSILSSKGEFVGFGRVITDFATFAYLGDVYVEEDFQGKGLGKFLIKSIMHHPRLQGLRNWFLYTKDAHTLYMKFGWKKLEDTSRAMIIKNPAKELYFEKDMID